MIEEDGQERRCCVRREWSIDRSIDGNFMANILVRLFESLSFIPTALLY
jgi:hypothetical protein